MHAYVDFFFLTEEKSSTRKARCDDPFFLEMAVHESYNIDNDLRRNTSPKMVILTCSTV